MVADKKKRGLGRGLSALMADVGEVSGASQGEGPERSESSIAIELIHPNPDQPRRHFDDEALDSLADSIRSKGVIQPLILRRSNTKDGHFEIVAGERRWRAAQRAGIHELPALVREFTDTEMLEVAIIENIQREDLNAIDEALSYQQLMDRFGHTQEQVASGLGKSRSHIANTVRLLSLPDDVREMVLSGGLSAGHARALVGHESASQLAKQIVKSGMSVRDTERLVKTSEQEPKKGARQVKKDADTRQIEKELAAHLKLRVEIKQASSGDGGKLVLNYKSLEQLDELLNRLSAS